MENKTGSTELAALNHPPPASYPQSSSNSSSPSHEFSFTISLHHSGPITTIHDDKTSKPNSHLAVDLSPADDIFFHGHLLPLHLLSQQYFPNYSSSPRFSTNSIDNNSFTHLPIRESSLLQDTNSGNVSKREDNNNNIRGKEENKTNKSAGSFSLFGLTRGRKGYQEKELDNKEKQQQQQQQNNNNKKKVGHDVIHALKRYLRMVQQPIVHFRSGIRREKINGFNGQAYSRSGNLMRKSKPEVRGRRGECSAPASMRTSPTNSGLLLATATATATATSTNYSLPPAANDSTMEELHAAIQAAIAHCKNSIAKEDNTNKQQLLNCS